MPKTRIIGEAESELISEYLRYSDGHLYWKLDRGFKMSAGDRAGCLHKSSGYIKVFLFGRLYRAHRVIFYLHHGIWPEHDIDHIDHDKTNNHIDNLRSATGSQNQRNRSRLKNNTSGCNGVSKSKSGWFASVYDHDKKRVSKHFKHLADAAMWRAIKAKEYGYHENHGRVDNG